MNKIKQLLNIKAAFYVALVIVLVASVSLGLALAGIKNNNNKEGNVLHISGLLEEKSIDDLFEQSALAVTGKVTGSESFQIESTTGGTANFTDYFIAISDVYRGSADEKTVTVRLQGGTVGECTEVCDPSPSLNVNEDYLLFLYQPGRGGAFNTEGDYYYILGLTQGTFTSKGSQSYRSQNGQNLSVADLSKRSAASPVDNDFFRTEYIENQKRNLENEFITQEEYNDIMKNIDVYATIVNK